MPRGHGGSVNAVSSMQIRRRAIAVGWGISVRDSMRQWIGGGEQPLVVVVAVTGGLAEPIVLPSFIPVRIVFECLVRVVAVSNLGDQAASGDGCAGQVREAVGPSARPYSYVSEA